jgi:hypothetical protein
MSSCPIFAEVAGFFSKLLIALASVRSYSTLEAALPNYLPAAC